MAATKQVYNRCHMCRMEVGKDREETNPHRKVTCERCEQLLRAPLCRACGEPVRGLNARRMKGDAEVYHKECRRCSSCYQVIDAKATHKMAGRLLCGSCAQLFGKFFLPDRRPAVDRMKEIFGAWDQDSNGSIETDELVRVLQALDPDMSLRDCNKLIRTIDYNGNGLIEYEEFCDWLVKADPLLVEEDGFEQLCNKLMRAAGKAHHDAKMDIGEVQLRTDGLYFIAESMEQRLETVAIKSAELTLDSLDPEEFINKVECNERGLHLTMNTGRVAELGGEGQSFGPWTAPEGFHIIGLRAKPIEGGGQRVVGIDVCPLANAKSYDAPASCRFAAEKDFIQTLRDILSKAAVDVNAFATGGISALMLAAQYGNVGSINLLIQSKANPNICDEDGWTALTYATHSNQTSTVKLLLDKGAKQDGDGGKALGEALRKQHNSAARALLRAGFGPAPAGTFALEPVVDAKSCKLQPPLISPAGGNYTKSVMVTLQHQTDDVRIFYTLDGRDPFLAGRRYRGPMQLSGDLNHIRAVAVRGRDRSIEADVVYGICHCAMPDEVVSGTLRIRTFPEVQAMVVSALVTSLEVPRESLRTELCESDENAGKVWVRMTVSDPKPRHKLHVDRNFTIVRGEKKKPFIEKFTADIQKATGGIVEDVVITAGSIMIDFDLERGAAEEMARQLSDPASYLLTRAKLKNSFDDAQFREDGHERLGTKLADSALHGRLHNDLGSKASIDEVVGIGNGDSGVVALAMPANQVKKIRKHFEQSMKVLFKEATFQPIQVGPEEIQLTYTVDVVNGHQENYQWVDGGTVVQKLNDPSFMSKMSGALTHLGLSAVVNAKEQATSRDISLFDVHIGAGVKDADYLDGFCMIYKEEHLAQVVDFRSTFEGRNIYDGVENRQAQDLCRSIRLAIQHSGNDTSDTNGEQHMRLDMTALPLEVTDIYFAIAAYDAADLSKLKDMTVKISDATSNRQLTEYTIASAGDAQAIIMCSLSRTESRKWIVKGHGIPTAGNVKDYEPIRKVLADLQGGYLNWERRQDLVKLRALHKLDRITKNSTSDFADLLNGILGLPIPVFQLLIKFL